MIKITRDEYAQKFGTQAQTSQPIKISRDDFAKKFGGYSPDMSTGDYLKGAAGNILPSLGKTALGIGEALVNTVNPDWNKNTLVGLGRVGLGAVQKLDPTGITTNNFEDNRPVVDSIGKFYKDRYGGIDNIKKTFYEDPTGVALDVSTIASGVGGLAKGAAGVTGNAKLAQIAGGLEKAGQVTNPFTYVGKAMGKVGSVVKPKIANTLEGMSEGYATSGLGNPKIIKDIQGVTGKKTSQLMKEYDLFDRSPLSVQKAIDSLDDVMSGNIKGASNAKVKDMLKQFDAKIAEYQKRSTLSTSARGQLEELIRRRKEFVNHVKGKNSKMPSSITADNVREMKKTVAEDVKKFSPDASKSIQTASAQDVYNIFKDKLNELAGTKQLGRDEAGLIQLKELFANVGARGQARQAVGLKDFIAGGAGGTVAGVPGAIAGIALRQLLDSPKGIQLITQTLQNGANGVRKMKIPNIFKDILKLGRVTRIANPK